MSTVPFLDLESAYVELKPELDDAYFRVMDSGQYILGDQLAAFEAAYANYCEVDHCIGVGNGLDALHLILEAFGIGCDDEVIVPANTYIATWLAVSHCRARLIPVEPEEGTRNLDPEQVEAAITSKTRAIIPVHLYGQVAEMDPILEIANRYGLKVIEDAAQAHGASYKGRKAGSLGNAAAWSYYPSKNLGAFGDAGAITTNDSKLAARVRTLRNYGSQMKYHHELKGYNTRMDPLQATFLKVKLTVLNEWNLRRKRAAEVYIACLSGIDHLKMPIVPEYSEPCWHQFTILSKYRDNLQTHLEKEGIETLIHYPVPPHLSDVYKQDGFQQGSFPVTEHLAKTILSLPIGPHMTIHQQERVINAVQSFFQGSGK